MHMRRKSLEIFLRRKRLWAFVFILLLSGGGYYWYLASRPTLADLERVQPGWSITQARELLGRPIDEASYRCEWCAFAVSSLNWVYSLKLEPRSALDATFKKDNIYLLRTKESLMQTPERHHFWIVQRTVLWVVVDEQETVVHSQLIWMEEPATSLWERWWLYVRRGFSPEKPAPAAGVVERKPWQR
jgi:hypothetical protein